MLLAGSYLLLLALGAFHPRIIDGKHLPLDHSARQCRFEQALRNYRTQGGRYGYENDGYQNNYPQHYDDRNQWEEDDYADYYDDDDYYSRNQPSRGRGRPAKRDQKSQQSAGFEALGLAGLGLGGLGSGQRKTGFTLVGAGMVFTILGMSLFFEKNLLRIGNLMLLTGLTLVIGPGRTVGWFSAKERIRATSTFLVGVFFVFIGKPVIGMLLEIFGFLNLFGNFFPLVFSLLKKMPFVGDLLGGSNNKRKPAYDERYSRRNQQQYYGYDDDDY
mmetsp:Transcript_12965/g.17071  ORF Transcript_12965/g.17071 Transcript_12965/m.17071 type:complete len:273 (+) Transcript_12965:37-855(+)